MPRHCRIPTIKDCLKDVVITLENGDLEGGIHDLREIIKDLDKKI